LARPVIDPIGALLAIAAAAPPPAALQVVATPEGPR
jgi:hypothetical protein